MAHLRLATYLRVRLMLFLVEKACHVYGSLLCPCGVEAFTLRVQVSNNHIVAKNPVL